MSYKCAITGDTSTLKHYVLKTTEGEELVSPAALLSDRRRREEVASLVERIEHLAARVTRLEAEARQEDGQEDDAAESAKPSPAKKTAAPAKKTPAQRKAVD